MKDLRDLMTAGVFGVDNIGNKFVVVNGIVVYEDGEFDLVKELTYDLEWCVRRIDKLYECDSFNQLNDALDGDEKYTCLYNRDEDKKPTVDKSLLECLKAIRVLHPEYKYIAQDGCDAVCIYKCKPNWDEFSKQWLPNKDSWKLMHQIKPYSTLPKYSLLDIQETIDNCESNA